MNKTIAIGIVVFLTILVLIPSASATWCDNNYGKKAPILINNTGGSEQTYYQVELNYSYDSDMNADFSDARVYNESDCSLVPLWNESAVASSYNKIWFNATNIPASSWCNNTYFLYYNYSSASSVSNGITTFEFFDDFHHEEAESLYTFNKSEIGLPTSHGHLIVIPADTDEDGKFEFLLFSSCSPGAGDDKIILLDDDGTTELWNSTSGLGSTTYIYHPCFMRGVGNINTSLSGLEIAVGFTAAATNGETTEQGQLQLLDKDGNELWHNDTYWAVESIAVGDIDNDGNDEIVVMWTEDSSLHNGRLVAYDEDAAELLNRQITSASGKFSIGTDMGLNVVDIDNDGYDEILMPGGDNHDFYCIRYNSSNISGDVLWTVACPSEQHGDDIVWGDIDNDSYTEIILMTSETSLTAREHNGTEIWSKTSYGNHLQNMWMVNNTNDEELYIYIGDRGGTPTVRKLYASNGTEIWSNSLFSSDLSWVSAYDLNGDGDEEIVVTTGSKVAIYDHDGNLIKKAGIGDKIDIGGEFGEMCQGVPNHPRNDLDGDGIPEIFADCGTDPHYDIMRIYNYSSILNAGSDEDDFDTDKWEEAWSEGTHGLTDNYAWTDTAYTAGLHFEIWQSKSNISTDEYILEAKVKNIDAIDAHWCYMGLIVGSQDSNAEDAIDVISTTDFIGSWGYRMLSWHDRSGDSITELVGQTNDVLANWHTWKVVRTSTQVELYVNDALKITGDDTGNLGGKVGVTTFRDQKGGFDDIRVRKYASSEPTAQLGNEESPSVTYTPPDPTNLQNTTGNFWVNYTWDAGSGNVTNSYNVSNQTEWFNGTTNTYYNESVSASEWVNITVYAWNSSGAGTLSAGSVSDQVQVSAADTTFTVSLPVGYTKPVFEPPNSTATNYPPNGQTDSQEFYNVTNSGNVNLDVRMRLNTTVSTITLKADADNNPTGADTIGTSLVTVYSGLGQGSSANVWLWSDFDHTPPQTANRTVYINVSQS